MSSLMDSEPRLLAGAGAVLVIISLLNGFVIEALRLPRLGLSRPPERAACFRWPAAARAARRWRRLS
jgi:hypothetical protein